MVTREIDFDGDNEVSITEDFLSSTSYTSELLFQSASCVLGQHTKSCDL